MPESDREYSRGPSTYQKPRARYDTKPATYTKRGQRDTGAGYCRWRSWEYDPVKDRKRDHYVSVHRLLAVVAFYPADQPLGGVLEDLAGKDVHHDSGFTFDNRPGNLSVLAHGRHSSVTNAERRAWAEDAKQAAKESGQTTIDTTPDGGCANCDAEGAPARIAGRDESFCVACAGELADGATIQIE